MYLFVFVCVYMICGYIYIYICINVFSFLVAQGEVGGGAGIKEF